MQNNLESILDRVLKITDVPDRLASKVFYVDTKLVVELLKEGLKWHEVAGMYNCHRSTLRVRVERDFPDFRISKYGLPNVTTAKIRKLYKKHLSLKKVSEMTDLPISRVRKRLTREGIKIIDGHRPDITSEKVVSLYKLFKKITNVSNFLGTSPCTIQRRLNEEGFMERYNPQRKRTRIDIPESKVVKEFMKVRLLKPLVLKYESSHETIRSILIRNGINPREYYTKRSDIDESKVVRMHDEGKSITWIAHKYKSHRRKIREILRENNRETTKYSAQSKRGNISEDKVVNLYANKTIEEIARKYRCSESTISEILHRRDIKVGKGRIDYDALSEREIARQYKLLGTVSEVARKYDTSFYAIKKVLIERGIKVRRNPNKK